VKRGGRIALPPCHKALKSVLHFVLHRVAFLPVFAHFILCQNRKEKADNPRSYQLFLCLSLFKDEQEQ